MTRSYTLDTIKGILIVLVIFAHIISKGPMTQYFSYFYSSFFMQLFFGISGFLITVESLHKPVKELFLKYWFRIIIPFLFAYFVYSLIEHQWLSLFPYPWFHLWFIVAFIEMIVFVYLMEKLKFNRSILLLIFFSFAIFWVGTYGTNGLNEVYYWMGHKAVYYNLVFFYFGYYLRIQSKLLEQKHWYIWLIFLSAAIYIWIFNHHAQINYLYVTVWSILNISMIYLVIFNALKYQNLKLPLITWMGNFSLPIYLLHIISLMLLKPYVEKGLLNSHLHILLYFIGVALVMVMIYAVQNTKFGKIFIMGEQI